MQTYILVDTRDGEIVDTKSNPCDLDFHLVRQIPTWEVAFRIEEKLNAGGPVTVIASVDYHGHAAENHDWIAELVAEELKYAYEEGELEPYLCDEPIVTVGGPVYAQIPISRFGVKSLRPLYRTADDCEFCGHFPCGCGG